MKDECGYVCSDFGEQGGSDSGQKKAWKQSRHQTPSKGKQATSSHHRTRATQETRLSSSQQQQDKGEEQPNGGDGNADGHKDFTRHFEDFLEILLIDYNSKRKRMTIILQPYDRTTDKKMDSREDLQQRRRHFHRLAAVGRRPVLG